MKSQNERILRHLKVRPITTLDAYNYLGCTRLSGRIYELRQKGYQIDSEYREVKNRRGETCRVKSYSLKVKP